LRLALSRVTECSYALSRFSTGIGGSSMLRGTSVHRFVTTALVALVVAGAAGCVPARINEVRDLRPAIDAIFARYVASLRAGDADAWAELWTEDGIQMPPDAPAVAGRTRIRETLRGALAAFRADMQIRTDEVRGAGDWAFARGTYTLTLTPKQGGAPVPVDGKFLTIFARQPDGSWKIHRDVFNSNVPPSRR
jgi:uncharacterized protein (TIGR02246 family)